ncbi:MAG: MBL fold metallo-hydrolase [Nitrospira sp.]|nr:MBL fold metallo-hydrolase [Nitrospira sp.]
MAFIIVNGTLGIVMRACIHRGTQEVGGTCIEIESAGKRIVLDVGLPLEAEDSEVSLPHVKGFRKPEPSLLAVVISHPHQDHYGLTKYLLPDTPMIMGAAAERILKAAGLFTPAGVAFQRVRHLEHRIPLSVGPFTLTPFLNDHSAYDAYSLLIEADGQRLFYSGDLRGHGRKARIFQQFLKSPPTDIDVLLMEGTTIGRRTAAKRFCTEQELEPCFVEQMRQAPGMVLVWTSAQNIDRLVTMFKACKKSGRQLVIDMYTAEILRATGNPKLPQATWEGIKVFLPQSQKRQILKGKLFTLANRYKAARIYPEQLAEQASRSVLLFRPSMRRDLEKAGCLKGARLIYSLWPGYLKRKEQHPFLEWLDSHHIPLTECHTSGHASISDLQAFAQAINPKMLVPIHSFETKRFTEFFDRVEQKEDGKWWKVS